MPPFVVIEFMSAIYEAFVEIQHIVIRLIWMTRVICSSWCRMGCVQMLNILNFVLTSILEYQNKLI